jgi:hypothetical protein
MVVPLGLLFLSGLYPLARAWWLNRRTPLAHALGWALAAWGIWTLAAFSGEPLGGVAYLALCLTGCAGIAVLGARQPGALAWNFVVVGLLAVLLRPFLEGFGELRLGMVPLLFLGGCLLVGVLNYLPTRLAVAMTAVGLGCATELACLAGAALPAPLPFAGVLCLAGAPWLGWLLLRSRRPREAFDTTWLEYRDRFGFVWGQRAREQFNRSVANAGWGVTLGWRGLQGSEQGPVPERDKSLSLLRAVLKRFDSPSGPREQASAP